MKGFVLALLVLLAAIASAYAGMDAAFGVTTDYASSRDPALMLRTPPSQKSGTSQLVSDTEAERRGSRPSVAYTLFRVDSKFADVSVQPVFGRINGAQLYVGF